MRKTITMSPTAKADAGIVALVKLETADQLDFMFDGALASGYDADGLYTSDTPTAAGTMAMDGDLATSTTLTTFASERFIEIYSDDDDSGVTFYVTGTNKEGHVITDAITGPSEIRTSSALKFMTVTNIHISGA